MPWEHCGATIADDQPCACGITKAQWTVEFQVTRQFRVTRRHVLRLTVLDHAELPVAGAAFEVRWPDGRVEAGELDDMGAAKLAGPASGACVVTFPGFDADSLHVERGGEPLPAGGDGAPSSTSASSSSTSASSSSSSASSTSASSSSSSGRRSAYTDEEGWVRDEVWRAHGAPPARFTCEAAATLRLRAGHWFEVELLDLHGTPRAGVEVAVHLADGSSRPATTDDAGVARWVGLAPGRVEVEYPKGPLRRPRWGGDVARADEVVELLVDAALPDGEPVRFTVIERDASGRLHDELAHLDATVQGGVARATWVVDSDADAEEPAARWAAGERAHHATGFVFRAESAADLVHSPPLPYRCWYEVELLDRGGRPRAGVECTLHLPDGSTRAATTNDEGVASWDDLPPGEVEVEYPKEGAGLRLSLVDAAGAPVAGERYRVEAAGAPAIEGALDDAGAATVTLASGAACTVTFPDRAAGALARAASAAAPSGPSAEDLDAEPVAPAGGDDARATFELDGVARELRLQEGPLSNARWGQARARFDDPVALLVDAPGLPDGAWVLFDVFEHDADGAHDPVARLAARARGGRASLGWHMPRVADADDEPTDIDRATGFPCPELGFVARHGEASARCADVLQLATDLELPLRDEAGAPLADVAYELRCGDRRRRGRTDAQGILRETGVGPDFTVLLEDGQEVWVRATAGVSA